MTKISSLFARTDAFISERDWWRFNTPKNGATNILVEACELAEKFIHHESVSEAQRAEVAEEIADVFFATLIFMLANKLTLSNSLAPVLSHETIHNESISFAQLQDLVVRNKENFGIASLATPRQVALSLISHVGNLVDMFIWCTDQDSFARADAKKMTIHTQCAYLVGHSIYFAQLARIDMVEAFEHKMQKNAAKYPVDLAGGEKYSRIKDTNRGR